MERSLSKRQRLYLFSDFDGTLARIVSDPKSARLEEKNRKLLANLVSNKKFKIALISGRSLEELKKMVGINGIYYVGNHGFEMVGPGINFTHLAAIRKARLLRTIGPMLGSALAPIQGVIIEDKRFTISVHYRMVQPALRKSVQMTVRRMVDKYKGLKLTTGKMIVEVRPRVRWHKGLAALRLLHVLGRPGQVIYIGDDKTDEDAFRSLRGAITIAVMKTPTKTYARYYLHSVAEVWRFIELLSKIII